MNCIVFNLYIIYYIYKYIYIICEYDSIYIFIYMNQNLYINIKEYINISIHKYINKSIYKRPRKLKSKIFYVNIV